MGPSSERFDSMLAAQTLMLAASARGYDSCPMEGFNPIQVAKVLTIRRGAVIPLVIALGRRREGARVEPQWRRPFESAVVVH
ncbi:MAG: nitroreductase family protein [Myxococcaceae bacterium]|nr:nitroreductase family protein [Myxococcaceae bacterium]